MNSKAKVAIGIFTFVLFASVASVFAYFAINESEVFQSNTVNETDVVNSVFTNTPDFVFSQSLETEPANEAVLLETNYYKYEIVSTNGPKADFCISEGLNGAYNLEFHEDGYIKFDGAVDEMGYIYFLTTPSDIYIYSDMFANEGLTDSAIKFPNEENFDEDLNAFEELSPENLFFGSNFNDVITEDNAVLVETVDIDGRETHILEFPEFEECGKSLTSRFFADADSDEVYKIELYDGEATDANLVNALEYEYTLDNISSEQAAQLFQYDLGKPVQDLNNIFTDFGTDFEISEETQDALELDLLTGMEDLTNTYIDDPEFVEALDIIDANFDSLYSNPNELEQNFDNLLGQFSSEPWYEELKAILTGDAFLF